MTERVLIVDDDKQWSERILGRYIARAGYAITIVDNCDDAYEVLRDASFVFMTLDMNLGYGSFEGRFILDHIKDEGIDISCIVITGLLERHKAFEISREFSFVVDLIDKENFEVSQLRDSLLQFKKGDEAQENEANEGIDLKHIRRKMNESLGINDLEELCFDLRIEYENIPGDTKRGKILGLIKETNKTQKLDDLVLLCEQKRPNILWRLSA